MSESAISAASMRIVKLLVGKPPATIADLVLHTGVTRTAVTEQLKELIGAGFVARRLERSSSPGRPQHVYFATNTALSLLFAGNQQLVVPAIWRAIAEIGGNRLTRDVTKRVTRSVADHYRPQITGRTPQERLRQINRILCEEGHVVEIRKAADGRLILSKRSCPFITMFDETRLVCGVDVDVLGDLLGQPVRRTACRHDGDPCCEFELANGKKSP